MISSLRYWIFGENFCLLDDRKNIFLSASRYQIVPTRPAKILIQILNFCGEFFTVGGKVFSRQHLDLNLSQ